MSFGEAIQSGFQHFTNWQGRAARPAFWFFILFYVICVVIGGIIDSIIGTTYVFAGIVWLVFLVPIISAQVRRLHDSGRTGWWWWLHILPILGTIILIIFFLLDSDEGDNQYGPNPMGGVSQFI